MSITDRGYCPECQKHVALKSDGTLWAHKRSAEQLFFDLTLDSEVDCPGSGATVPARPAVRIEDVVVGADFREAEEGATLTNEQLWARLLLMTVEERMKFLAMMQEAAHEAHLCFMKNHAGLEQEAAWWHDRSIGYAAAATVQKHEAETYYNRMRTALIMAHQIRRGASWWRCPATDSGGAQCTRREHKNDGHRISDEDFGRKDRTFYLYETHYKDESDDDAPKL